jgi:hypothetical protein
MTSQEIERLRREHWRPASIPTPLFHQPLVVEKTWWNTDLLMMLKNWEQMDKFDAIGRPFAFRIPYF